MPEKDRERSSKYNLITTVDNFASQSAQNPATSRMIKGLVPSAAGFIDREKPWPKLATNTLPAKITWLYEFDQNIAGTIVRYFFAAAGGLLYGMNSSTSNSWSPVTVVGTLANNPVAVTIGNVMHFSDGVTPWLFDGTGGFVNGSGWVIDGLPIPQHAPTAIPAHYDGTTYSLTSVQRINGVVTVKVPATILPSANQYATLAGVSDATFNNEFQIASVSGSSGAVTFTFLQPGYPDTALISSSGTYTFSVFTVQSTKYYWTTFADHTNTRPHESSSSPRSLGTGAFTSENVVVHQRSGSMTTSSSSTIVVGVGTDWSSSDVGMVLYGFDNILGYTQFGVIASVTDSQHLTLVANALDTVSGGNFEIAPLRATHWHIYCSEAESSAIGFLLAEISLTGFGPGFTFGSGTNGPFYYDQSPFAGVAGSYIDIDLERPIRNDPPSGTKIMEVHKNRIFRRNEQLQDFFNFTAYEEVLAFGVGDPRQSVPGHDPNTLSDIVDEDPYPDQSVQIRSLCSYADCLFIGSDKNTEPLFGESINDFVLSQITAFSIGAGSRYCMKGTAQGLIFLSADKKLLMWPSQWIPFYAPEETSQLIELSRPLRNTFQSILSSDIDNVQGAWFYYGSRNWFAVCFQDNTSNYQTWIFDFEIKGWFQLHAGVASLAVFEPQLGDKILVGGGIDGNVYILDDQNSLYSTIGLTFPAGTFRPALIDFGAPDTKHVLKYFEYEVSNPNMQITVNYYLDPQSVDNPGTPQTLVMAPVRLSAGRFRGFFTSNNTGSTCERVLMEILVASDSNSGVIRSFTLGADPGSKLTT